MAAVARVLAASSIVLPQWISTTLVAIIVGTGVTLVGYSIVKTWTIRRSFAGRPDATPGERSHLYAVMEPYAENVKVVLQMFIGGGLAAVILLKLLDHLGIGFDVPLLAGQVYGRPTLQIVGLALAYSSALELAYALFTHGPDEAVEPLIMGLAAAILLVVSGIETIDLLRSAGVLLLVVALAGLFVVRQFFIVSDETRHPGRRRRRHSAVEDGRDLPT
jgi:hypothetical protein